MNHNWLPLLAKSYDAELCDQRMLWKAYLRYDPQLGPSPAESWVKTFDVGGDVKSKPTPGTCRMR